MSQNDLSIANQGFPATRTDLNSALQALGSTNSGSSAPSTTYANQLWYDTANNILKIRNEDNDNWISLITLDQTNDNVESLTADSITESTSGSGVTIDSVILKDGGVGSTSSAVTLNASSLNNGQFGGRRNMIYNGNFQCWQRSTNETGLGASSGYFTADRWKTQIGGTSAGRYTMTRTAGDPDGFNYGLVINCTTADTSIASDEVLILRQTFEGQDLQHLKKGTSSAKKTVLCFYAKVVGSATDIVVEIRDKDNDRHICKKFTLTTSWAKYEFVIDGDTTGALDQDTSASLDINFFLHAGSNYTSGTLATSWASRTQANRAVGVNSIFASTSNEFYIAGVQWEIGSTSTEFEYRTFGEEQQLCYRYYYQMQVATNFMKVGHGRAYDSNNTTATYPVPVPMRANPTGSVSAHSDWGVAGLSSGGTTSTNPSAETMTDFSRFAINITRSGGGFSAGTIYQVEADNNTNATIKLDAEL